MDRTDVCEEIQVSITIEDDEEIIKSDSNYADEDTAASTCRRLEYFTEKGLTVHSVEIGGSDYEIIKRCFVDGMRDFVKVIDVVGVYRRNYKFDLMEIARVEAFRVFSAAVARKNGGDSNVKYAWYGGSRDEIRNILLYGFRRSEDIGNRPSLHGRGVSLSPANFPIESVSRSVAGADGLRHALLCRVILGKPEAISIASQMSQPSSVEFDSGVDNISSPNKYIIWEPYMNTHILPVFIVSFKANPLTGVPNSRIPTSQHLGMHSLVKRLENYLSSSKMALVTERYHDFKRNRIMRSGFIRSLRLIAGDDVLRAVIQGLR